jgi:hypothetical protein
MLKKTGFDIVREKKHWQILELGYIFTRMQAYVSGPAKLGSSIVKAIGMEKAQIPYWMGQALVIAKHSKP